MKPKDLTAKKNTQAATILDFYRSTRPDFVLPAGISVMNPYQDKQAWPLIRLFYEKYYNDAGPRGLIFGINPGRFGAGMTGIPFTDPLRLEQDCGIPNDWKKKEELSGQFIYKMIHAYGGVQEFYGDYFFTSLSPLGFVKDGKNLNYYDDRELLKSCEPYMVACIRHWLAHMPSFPVAFCLGEGENYKHFNRLNEKHGFFEKIIALPHPRWIMQYRRKEILKYADLYVEKLRSLQ